MKNITKLIMVVGFLMQHGVAQASWINWINDELLGAKQAGIVRNTSKEYKKYIMNEKSRNAYLENCKKDQKAFDEIQCIKAGTSSNKLWDENHIAFCRKRGEVELAFKTERRFIEDQYYELSDNAQYLRQRRDAIKPYGCFGLHYLSLPINNEVEKEYENSRTQLLTYVELMNFYRNPYEIGHACNYITAYENDRDCNCMAACEIDRIYNHITAYENAILQFNREQRVYQNRVVAATGVVLISVVAGYLLANKK